MALDTKQKRGSAMSIGMPGRPWASVPAGSLAQLSRQSIVLLCSTPLFAVPQTDPIPITVTLTIDRIGAAFAIDRPAATFTADRMSAEFSISRDSSP